MESPESAESLDPQDWEAMRKLAHKMVDDSIDYLATVSERPVWEKVPEDIAHSFDASVPTEPQDPEEVYKEFQETIFPYPMGNIHPRFWAWYMGNGTMMGALGDFMAAVMNPNIGAAATHRLWLKVRWLAGLRKSLVCPKAAVDC